MAPARGTSIGVVRDRRARNPARSWAGEGALRPLGHRVRLAASLAALGVALCSCASGAPQSGDEPTSDAFDPGHAEFSLRPDGLDFTIPGFDWPSDQQAREWAERFDDAGAEGPALDGHATDAVAREFTARSDGGRERGAGDLGAGDLGAGDLGAGEFGRRDFTGSETATYDRSCVVGTPDHCAHCDDRCPGIDDASTRRTCIERSCSIRCEAAYFDVNNDPLDGCEFADDSPAHHSELNPRSLGALSDCDLALRVKGRLPSDERLHGANNVALPQGQPDWLRLQVLDELFCSLDPQVTIDLSEFPPSGSYRVSLTYRCLGGYDTTDLSRTLAGATKTTIPIDTLCTLFGDDSGTLTVGLQKLSGPHSSGDYLLTIAP